MRVCVDGGVIEVTQVCRHGVSCNKEGYNMLSLFKHPSV